MYVQVCVCMCVRVRVCMCVCVLSPSSVCHRELLCSFRSSPLLSPLLTLKTASPHDQPFLPSLLLFNLIPPQPYLSLFLLSFRISPRYTNALLISTYSFSLFYFSFNPTPFPSLIFTLKSSVLLFSPFCLHLECLPLRNLRPRFLSQTPVRNLHLRFLYHKHNYAQLSFSNVHSL